MSATATSKQDVPTVSAAAAAPAGASSVVHGASLLIALQIASRAATFAANQLLLRFLTAQLLGVATQLEVYYLSVLFFARESLRVAIQRQGGRTPPSGEDGSPSTPTSSSSSQSAVNLAYVSVLLGALVALLLGWLYLASVRASSVAATPYLVPSLYIYAAAAVVELLSEPAFVVLQLRLQFRARAAAEAVATVLRCATTLGTAVLAARAGRDIGVLPFALGQMAYGVGLLAVYTRAGWALARGHGFSLRPRRLAPAPSTEADYALQLFDRPTLHLASSMAAQSIVKHVLTQGDTFLVSVLSTPTAQGVYALANNYGGLVARLLFQPIEESSRSYFSRLLADDSLGGAGEHEMKTKKTEADQKSAQPPAARAAHDLQMLLKLYLLFSLVATTLGPAAAAPFLAIVTGPRWAASGAAAAATLAAYVWYIQLLAVNGVAEAFVASVATEAEVHRQSAWMGVFSLVFGGAGYVCLRVLDGNAVGLVAANAINMACRIVWCLAFIRRYFAARGVSFFGSTTKAASSGSSTSSISGITDVMLPHPLAVLAAVATSAAIQRLVVVPASLAPAAGVVAQIMLLAKIAALGIPFVLAVYVSVSRTVLHAKHHLFSHTLLSIKHCHANFCLPVCSALFERRFLRSCYNFARTGGQR